MVKKEPIRWTGKVEKVEFPNKGTVISTADEAEQKNVSAAVFSCPTRKAHIKNVLPGQTVLVQQSSHQAKRKDGKLIELISKAPYETEPNCSYCQICGGCSYQTVPYEIQLQWKEQSVRDLMANVWKLMGDPEDPASIQRVQDEVFMPILPSPVQFAYRNKMEFTFGDTFKGGPLTCGLHKQDAYHDIVPVSDCAIIHEDVQKILICVRDFFEEKKVSFHNTMSHQGYLRHLVLRRSEYTGDVLVNVVTASDSTPEENWKEENWKELESRLTSLNLKGKVSGLLHTINDSLADVVQADRLEVLYGTPNLTENLLGLTFELSPFSFFQTNSKGAEVLYQCVIDFANGGRDGHLLQGKTVFDLYCGTGTIAQLIAHAGARRVLGIEIVEEAVEAAKVNAQKNGLENCEFFAGDVLKLVDSLQVHPDLIVLDPPRDGIHPKAMQKILNYAPDQFVYVSCKPTSLARDLPSFLNAGYQIQAVRPVDMFPGTYHVETVVLLSRKN